MTQFLEHDAQRWRPSLIPARGPSGPPTHRVSGGYPGWKSLTIWLPATPPRGERRSSPRNPRGVAAVAGVVPARADERSELVVGLITEKNAVDNGFPIIAVYRRPHFALGIWLQAISVALKRFAITLRRSDLTREGLLNLQVSRSPLFSFGRHVIRTFAIWRAVLPHASRTTVGETLVGRQFFPRAARLNRRRCRFLCLCVESRARNKTGHQSRSSQPNSSRYRLLHRRPPLGHKQPRDSLNCDCVDASGIRLTAVVRHPIIPARVGTELVDWLAGGHCPAVARARVVAPAAVSADHIVGTVDQECSGPDITSGDSPECCTRRAALPILSSGSCAESRIVH